MAKGGFLIPPEVMDDITSYYLKDPVRIFPRGPRPRLTRRQRFALWRARVRWTIHEWLFPDCVGDDY